MPAISTQWRPPIATTDTCCTLVPYFKVAEGQLAAFKALGEQFVAKTRSEPGCVHYAFSFSGQETHCREGCDDAAALLAHLENVGSLLQQALKISELTRLEVHAPEAQTREAARADGGAEAAVLRTRERIPALTASRGFSMPPAASQGVGPLAGVRIGTPRTVPMPET